jgi:hypothetical protein
MWCNEKKKSLDASRGLLCVPLTRILAEECATCNSINIISGGRLDFPRQSYAESAALRRRQRSHRERKTLPQFPRDRSQPDGCWHTCKECNTQRCGFLRWAVREHKKWELIYSPPPPANPRRRLGGLKSYRKKSKNSGEPFSNLPPLVRCFAEQLYINYLHKHRGPRLTQQKRALLMATAASNARRVGDRSWARRMWRLKGLRQQRLLELRRP